MKNEYYVAIDSNGKPYIAHALFGGTSVGRGSSRGSSRGSRQNVKYLEKINDGTRTRYFYTQDELRAFYNKGTANAKKAVANVKQKVTQTARDKIGFTAKENRDKAQRALTDARAKDMAADKIFKVNYQKEQNAEQKLQEAKNATKAAQANLDRLTKQHDLHANIASGHKKSFDDFQKLGVENSDAAKQAYKLFVNNNASAADLKVKMKQAERDLKSAQRKEAETEKAYKDAYDKTSKDLDKYTHESGYGMKDTYESETMRNARRAEEKYAKTPLAKIEKAKEKVEDMPEDLTKKLKQVAANAKDFATNVKQTIDSSINETQKSQQRKQTAKLVDKADDSFKKWKVTHKRPGDNMFTFDNDSGQTVKRNAMYDKYMELANDTIEKLHKLNESGNGWGAHTELRDTYISDLQNYMKQAAKYSN